MLCLPPSQVSYESGLIFLVKLTNPGIVHESKPQLKGKSPYGKCSVIINTKKQVASIPKRAKGIVARAYLYMSYTYKIPLTMDQIDLFRYWNRKYRVTRNECIRNELIKEIQGNYNPFVKLQCKNFKL